MRRTEVALLGVLLAAMAATTACRRGAAPADLDAAAPVATPADPWAPPPPDSLYGATAVENLRVVEAELEIRGLPRGWDGMRLAVVAELQLGLWPDNERVAAAALERAVAAEPDLVVLLGSFIGQGGEVRPLRELLAGLRGRPAVAVLGERDLRSDSLAIAVASTLRGRGVTVLRNELLGFQRGGDTAYVAGIEPPLASFTPSQQQQLFAELPPDAATPLLLSPRPDVLLRLPEARFPAVTAAHTFCGQLQLPGTPRLATLADETLAAARLPRANRLYRSAGNTLFVTCGIGFSFVPARFAAPPEVVLLTLLRVPDPAPAEEES